MSIFKQTIRNRVRSFGYAFSGIVAFLKSEPNGRIHAVATVLVIAAGFYFDIGLMEWGLLVLVMGLVWITEILNTAIEKAMDHVAPGRHTMVKFVKDVAAAAVLIAAITAVVIGGIIFLPKIAEFL
ncbi:diacylglycerol kinase family protein [Chitinophaga horti]|uniref:Diacylglycerol kinase family protein n=1 Tax=Chitinophaga horti TaxID=2920382 RepID=A0ABY6J122_9BACT|nr:diacylglycerol kinase family protein [Chitinophaga horti]UYQ93106.1 diacylglycerol kinase family protein [Chitinophaga horti]